MNTPNPELAPRLRQAVRDFPGFPQPGVVFKDIAPVLGDPGLFKDVIDELARAVRGRSIDKVAGIESRGFIIGAPLAVALGAGFVPVRKLGRLPGETRRVEYALEYGTGVLEVQADALRAGDRVYLVDDVLATGGTAAAAIKLLQGAGATVEMAAFLIELGSLQGRSRLTGQEMISLATF